MLDKIFDQNNFIPRMTAIYLSVMGFIVAGICILAMNIRSDTLANMDHIELVHQAALQTRNVERMAYIADNMVTNIHAVREREIHALRQKVDDFARNHQNIIDMELSGDHNDKYNLPVREKFFKEPVNLDKKVKSYIAQVNAFLKNYESGMSLDTLRKSSEYNIIQRESHGNLTKELAEVTHDFEAMSAKISQKIARYEFIYTALFVTLLFVVTFVIFLPMIKRIKSQMKDLEFQRHRAEEANRLKSEFLATMSHEIRSPMSGVLGMAELLMETSQTRDQEGYTRTIIKSGEALLSIIEDILDFSKIEANKIEIDPIAVNLVDLVDDISTLYSSKAREKAIELAVYYKPGTEQFVYVDPVRLRQVLGNLINNAIKFTDKGHVVVSVREAPGNVPEDKVNISISVEDTGIGIAPNMIDKIFEKFQQADTSTTRTYGGTGLGLSISKSLVEMMGGRMTVQSQVNKGSVFTFILPLTRNREEVFIQPKPPVLRDVKALVVDDMPVIRTLMNEQLSAAGLRCGVARSGAECLDMMRKAVQALDPYQIVVVDYLMPEMNGEMLARAINDEPALRQACLIMLTAAGNPILDDAFAEKGFSAYIAKPVRAKAMIESLAYIWTKYKEGMTDILIRVDTQSLGRTKTAADAIKLEQGRILIAEDSRINQAFAEEVLKDMGCQVTVVSNGQEALDELAKNTFDLVLMDCQMPVMDGFEASRRILDMKRQGAIKSDMPVIALTANAMQGDRKKCIDAGMNDYLAKPVRRHELKEMVYRWITGHAIPSDEDRRREGALSAIAQTSQGRPGAETHILDPEILEEAKRLFQSRFPEMVSIYIEDMESYIKEIEAAFEHENAEDALKPAHSLKSTSARLGAIELSNAAKLLEHAARDVKDAGSKEWTDHMRATYATLQRLSVQTRDILLEDVKSARH